MPFKSRAQIRKFEQLVKEGKITYTKLVNWIEETPNIDKLPEKIRKKKK